MKIVWEAEELSRFRVTRPTNDPAIEVFFCCICAKDVSVMTHGVHEILRFYQGTEQFIRDQHLCLGTPGWRMLDFESNPMREEEVEWQREQILRAPQIVRDREYPFSEDLIGLS